MVRFWREHARREHARCSPFLSPTYLSWDFQGEEVEAPGGQGLQKKEKKISSKWPFPEPLIPGLL